MTWERCCNVVKRNDVVDVGKKDNIVDVFDQINQKINGESVLFSSKEENLVDPPKNF